MFFYVPSLTRMDYFILASTIMIFVCLGEAVVTAYLARTERLKLARWIGRFMRIAFPTALVLVGLKAFVL